MLKAKQRITSILVSCCMLVLTAVLAVSTLVLPTSVTASAAEMTETISVFGTTGTLASGNGSISWSGEHFTFTNVKGSTAIRTSDSDHYRVYANSGNIISANNGEVITKVVITCTSSSYATVCGTSAENAGYTVEVSGSAVTITVDDNATTVTFTASAQTRFKTVAVTYVEDSSEPICEHANKTTTTTNATCTTDGSIVVTCDDCDETISTEVIPATGHVNQTTTTTNATCTTDGSIVVTCDDCGETVSTETIEALGHNFAEPTYERNGNQHTSTGTCTSCGETTSQIEDCTLSYENVSKDDKTHDMTSTCSVCKVSATENVGCTFEEELVNTTYTYTCKYCGYSYEEAATTYAVTYSVPTGITAVEAVEVVDGYTTVLPSAEEDAKYTFVGWTTAEMLEESQIAPTFFKEGEEYEVTADVTLYALYSFAGDEVEETWNLVKDVATLAVGKEIVIVASGSDCALGTTQNTNNRTAVDITKSGETVVIGNTVQIITLEAGTVTNTFAFNVGNGYLYAASSSSNHLKTKTTLDDNGSWLISIDAEGIATIKAQGSYTRNWIRKNSSSALFSCYGSGQNDVSIYMKAGGAITYYTTSFGEAGHTHEYSAGEVTSPTCTEEGYTTYTCECGDTYKDDYVEATGHSYEESITKAATCTENGVKTFTCHCEDSYTETIPALGHNYVNGTCENCGEEQEIQATLTFDDTTKRTEYSTTQQVWKENGVTVTNNKASSTTTVGNYSNPVRFYKNSTVTIEYPGMKVIEFIANTTGYATALKNSLSEGTVTVNSKTVTIVLSETKDSYEFTCGEQIRLDAITVYTTVANMDSASITIGEDITMNYYVTMPNAYADATMYFTVDGTTIDMAGEKAGDRYVFSLPQLAPQYMTMNIEAVLCYNETELDRIENYSIKTYAQNQLNNSPSDELKQLLTDLLHYGDAAQKYKDVNVAEEDLATYGVENIGTASTAMPEEMNYTLTKNEEISSYPAYFKSVGVWFDSENKIYVKINTAENVTLKINNVDVAVTGTTIYTDGIKATGFADTYTFELYYDDGDGDKLMQTLTYSINIYTYKMQSSENEAMRNLALALYRYGVSAKAYQE